MGTNTKKKDNIEIQKLDGHRDCDKYVNSDYGTIAYFIPRTVINKFAVKDDGTMKSCDTIKKVLDNEFAANNPELRYNCIYFLIGYERIPEKGATEKMYVGQAAIRNNNRSVLDRLAEHMTDTSESYHDEWDYVAIVTNASSTWTPNDLCILEYIFWSLIPSDSRYNANIPGAKVSDQKSIIPSYSDKVNQISSYMNKMQFSMFSSKDDEVIKNDVEEIAAKASDRPVDLAHGATRIPDITTPQDTVDAMVSLIDQKYFDKTETRFIDLACKGGEYLIALFKRFEASKAHRSHFTSDSAQRIYIIKEQLFGIALTRNSEELTKERLRKLLKTDEEKKEFDDICNVKVIPGYADKINDIAYLAKKVTKKKKNKNENTEEVSNITEEDYKKNKERLLNIIEEEFGKKDMKFNVIIGNPPYQEATYSGLNESGGKALFDKFILNGIDLSDEIVCLITPSKWMSGNQDNYIKTRKRLTEGDHIVSMVDYFNPYHVFPETQIAGGVSYFLYDKNYCGPVKFTSKMKVSKVEEADDTGYRTFNKDGVIPRHVIGENIINKIGKDAEYLDKYVSKNTWNLPTNYSDGSVIKDSATQIKIITPNGEFFENREDIADISIDKYKVRFTRAVSGSTFYIDSTKQILSSIEVVNPGEICNASYMTINNINKKEYAENIKAYLETKFVRFLVLQKLFGTGLTADTFKFVPVQDFKQRWTDEALYKKYNLTDEEINFIEKIIRPIKSNKPTSSSPKSPKYTKEDLSANYVQKMIQANTNPQQ